MIELDTIVAGDCIQILETIAEPLADLIFADPPFNIGYKYDVYEDRKAYDEYRAWTEQWMAACKKVLKPAGTFWVAIGDEYAAEVRILGRKLGLHLRNWVVWHYTFGQNTKRKFARSHTHLFYFVNSPTEFTFNDKAVRTFSDRQRVYRDKRANKDGRIPDDVWSEFPRLCGTFAEREGWHPCQMPETILARIIRACSNVGDLVLDPFAGSGTTLVTAKKLCRRYLGIEVSGEYVQQIQKRLAATRSMAEIEGSRKGCWPQEHLDVLAGTYMEAAVSTDALFSSTRLLEAFANHFNWRLRHSGAEVEYGLQDVRIQLQRLREAGKLGMIKVHAVGDMLGRRREPTGLQFGQA